MEIKVVNQISSNEWDDFVREVYQRPYCLQQQDGCMENGSIVYITVPDDDATDYERDTIPETTASNEMGVSFQSWLNRNPKTLLGDHEIKEAWVKDIWWDRNFYPSVEVLANDLFQKGLLNAGEYQILVEW